MSLKKIIIHLLFLPFFIVYSHSSELKLPALQEIGSTQWVQEKIKEYPELKWLLDKNVQHTQEGKSQELAHSWSFKMTGNHYPEFERTMLSLVCLYLIIDGSDKAYERFVLPQLPQEKLSRASFEILHKLAISVIGKDSKTLKAIEANLILGDMGKTKIARDKAKLYGIVEPDHDQFLDECLKKCPHIFVTFKTLPKKYQRKIKKVTGLVHFGHVTHIEGGPEILSKLKQSEVFKNNFKEYDFEVLTHFCDVSAARGHEDNQGSKVMFEDTFKALNAVTETLHYLSNHSEEEALRYYALQRAKWLGLKRDSKKEIVLARLGAMMRFFSEEDGTAMKVAYEEMTDEDKKVIEGNLDPFVIRKERTPTYIPAVLVNLFNTYLKQGMPREDAIHKSTQKGALAIATILDQYRGGKANHPYDPHLIINFNKVAGQLRDNPDLLEGFTFKINEEGIVELQNS